MKKFLVFILIIINMTAILALWGCCLSTYANPATHPRMAIVGLAFPVILVANVAMILPWLLVRKRLIMLPLVGIGVCYTFIRDYCPFNRTKEVSEGAIKVITWNCHAYGNATGASADEKWANELTSYNYLKECKADIICLQEANGADHEERNAFEQSMDSAGYEKVATNGLTVFTKYHIADTTDVRYHSRGSNSSLVCTLTRANDTLLLINNHFESDQISTDHEADYHDAITNPNESNLKALGITFVDLLSEAASVRSQQIDSVATLVQEHQGWHIIVCGDFNDTPISYSYQEMKKHLSPAYREAGNGIGLTYNKKKFPVRIDHLFCSKNLKAERAEVDTSIATSDHYPVVFWLKK